MTFANFCEEKLHVSAFFSGSAPVCARTRAGVMTLKRNRKAIFFFAKQCLNVPHCLAVISRWGGIAASVPSKLQKLPKTCRIIRGHYRSFVGLILGFSPAQKPITSQLICMRFLHYIIINNTGIGSIPSKEKRISLL